MVSLYNSYYYQWVRIMTPLISEKGGRVIGKKVTEIYLTFIITIIYFLQSLSEAEYRALDV